MDELDFLKSHWQQDDQFPRVKAEEIRRMRHRSSSSIVKWIFIISVLELFAGIALSLFAQIDNENESPLFDMIYTISDLIFYPVIFYFIYRFFKAFVNIRSTKSTKKLMEAILHSRKFVNYYIQFNIYYIFLGFIVIGAAKGYEKAMDMSSQKIVLFATAFAVVMILIGLIFYFVVRTYYRILYGILLNKLTKNYEELLSIEQEIED